MLGKHFYTAHDFWILHGNDHKRGVKTCEILDKFNVAQTCENHAQNLSTNFIIKNQLTANTKNVLYMHNIPSCMCRRSAAIVQEQHVKYVLFKI
jgi:hypothetical protein